MCGIAGAWNYGDEKSIETMTRALDHRGPDDHGTQSFYLSDIHLHLGHTRLSIQDLSDAGHQPMPSESGKFWIVFNGEIYNFHELRNELIQKGYQFKSGADTEVIVNGFQEWGSAVVERLNGIFAFAIFDQEKESLFIARDRFGVKPLYYTEHENGVLFASEIKSILTVTSIKKEVNMEALLAMANYRYTPDPLTLFEGVTKLEPGHFMEISRAGINKRCFYKSSYEVDTTKSESQLTEELEEELKEAVARQRIADVEVGFFLSGGLDSSALISLSDLSKQKRVKSFTIGFRDEDAVGEGQPDDLKYARIIAKKFECEHQEIILQPNIVESLPKVIHHLDEPIADPAAISSFLICEQARSENIKVLLSGQGADEVFCGYPWHLGGHLAQQYKKIPKPFRYIGESLISKLPASSSGKMAGSLRRMRKFFSSASKDFEEGMLGFLSYAKDDDLKGLFGPRYADAAKNGQPHKLHKELLEESQDMHHVNRMLHLDMGTFLPSLNLNYTDKTSMAHGIEVRVPLIDNKIVDFMSKVDPKYKIKGRERKYLLKKALEKTLPNEVIYRKKGGFGAPIRTWIHRDLDEMIGDLLSEKRIEDRGYFDPKFVHQLIKLNKDRREDYSYLIYFLLSFEIWHQQFID